MRYRRQDSDIFGEEKFDRGLDPFGEPIQPTRTPFENIEAPDRTPPDTPPTRGGTQNPFGQPRPPQVENPFRAPNITDPIIQPPTVDPSPRVPRMDTEPVLPPGGEFTPDRVPEMPTPDGGNRTTERARSERSTPDPDKIDPREFDPGSLETREPKDEPQTREPEDDPQTRTPTRNRGRDLPDYDDPRRPFRSNVYRPAKEPSHFVNPANPNNLPPGGANPYAPYPNPYANPAANPYANPYAANPYANPYAAAPYPPNPYMMYPYAAPVNGYGMVAAMGCPPCNCGTNCGGGCGGCGGSCGSSCGGGCNDGCGSYASNNYSNCPTPTPATTNDVYNPVVSKPACLGIAGRGLNNPLMPSGVPLYYVSLFGGWSDLSDLAIVSDDGQINFGTENGLGLGFALGQIQGKNLRSELEFSYRNHDVDNLFLSDFSGGQQTLAGVGDVESFAGMLNLYWEFVDLFGDRLSPYIGAGVGAVNVSAETRLDSGQDAFNDGEDSSFAYQYMVGINYKVRSYSDLFVEYRYFAADSLRLDTSLPSTALLSGDGELDYKTNNIFFGMRLKF